MASHGSPSCTTRRPPCRHSAPLFPPPPPHPMRRAVNGAAAGFPPTFLDIQPGGGAPPAARCFSGTPTPPAPRAGAATPHPARPSDWGALLLPRQPVPPATVRAWGGGVVPGAERVTCRPPPGAPFPHLRPTPVATALQHASLPPPLPQRGEQRMPLTGAAAVVAGGRGVAALAAVRVLGGTPDRLMGPK